MINNINIKYYSFNANKFQGYRVDCEKKEILKYGNKLKNIKGFVIYSIGSEYINFTIDNQLIRNIKLESLGNNIKENSINFLILNLIKKSTEVESSENFEYPNCFCWYNTNGVQYNDDNLIEIQERKNNNHNLSKIHNQKLKQYNSKYKYRR